MRTLIRNAKVLTLDDGDREFERADILVEDRRIAAIGAAGRVRDPASCERIIDASGRLAMPGLVNGHLHSSSNFFKGAFDPLPLELLMLYQGPVTGRCETSRFCYLRTLLGAVEMIKRGVTAVHDDHFYFPAPHAETIDGVMQAYADSGMRAVATLDQHNVVEYRKQPYLADLLPEDERRKMDEAAIPSAEDLLAAYRHLIEHWHGHNFGRLGAAVSCSAPQRVTRDYLHALSALSRQHALPFDIHLLETKPQRVLGDERHGGSLIGHLHKEGILDERVLAIHAVWADARDVSVLAQSGCTVAHNPISNLRIGSGVMPFAALRDAGVPICLGTDEACLNDTLSVWRVLQVAGLIHTLSNTDPDRWPQAGELLRAATRGGARGMGMAERTGTLSEGYEADLILLDLDAIAFTPLNNLRRQLVYCEDGTSVTHVMVAGRLVVEDGRLLTVDEDAVKAEVREAMACQSREFQAAEAEAERLAPYYMRMWRKAMSRDVGLRRRMDSH